MNPILPLTLFRINNWYFNNLWTNLQAVISVATQNLSCHYSDVPDDFALSELMEDCSSAHGVQSWRSLLHTMEKTEGYKWNMENTIC